MDGSDIALGLMVLWLVIHFVVCFTGHKWGRQSKMRVTSHNHTIDIVR